MSGEKVKELQEFVDDFNRIIKNSFKLYEIRNRKEKNLKKNFSQINNEIKKKNKFPNLTFKRNKENKTSLKYDSINKSTIWKQSSGVPNYFEEFKCLHDSYDLSIWEKVSK